MTKDFKQEFFKLLDRVKSNKPFAFSKYADGEYLIFKNINIDNGEFSFIQGQDELYRQKLIESIKYKHPDYVVAIGCKCCIGDEAFNWYKEFSEQDEENNLTFANVFVNSNFKYYVEYMIPEYNNHDIIIVCNENSNIDNLPFKHKIVKDFRIGIKAWVNNYNLIEEIKQYISDNNIKNHLFLFCAGPFGNLLAHQLFDFNKENLYIDIGSTLNPWLNTGNWRGYYSGAPTKNKICIW